MCSARSSGASSPRCGWARPPAGCLHWSPAGGGARRCPGTCPTGCPCCCRPSACAAAPSRPQRRRKHTCMHVLSGAGGCQRQQACMPCRTSLQAARMHHATNAVLLASGGPQIWLAEAPNSLNASEPACPGAPCGWSLRCCWPRTASARLGRRPPRHHRLGRAAPRSARDAWLKRAMVLDVGSAGGCSAAPVWVWRSQSFWGETGTNGSANVIFGAGLHHGLRAARLGRGLRCTCMQCWQALRGMGQTSSHGRAAGVASC